MLTCSHAFCSLLPSWRCYPKTKWLWLPGRDWRRCLLWLVRWHCFHAAATWLRNFTDLHEISVIIYILVFVCRGPSTDSLLLVNFYFHLLSFSEFIYLIQHRADSDENHVVLCVCIFRIILVINIFCQSFLNCFVVGQQIMRPLSLQGKSTL